MTRTIFLCRIRGVRHSPTAREGGSRSDGRATAAPPADDETRPASSGQTRAASSGGARARSAVVWGALAAATLVKLYLALRTAGTLDVAAYADFARKARELGGVGLYHDPGAFSPYVYLPFGIHLLRLLDWLASATALPFGFWLRLPSVLADAGSLLLVWRHFGRAARDAATRDGARDGETTRDARRGEAAARAGLTTGQFASLLLLALSPVSVVVSGFHGNTDPLMIFFALLSASLVEGAARGGAGAKRGRLELAAGVAFGMALNVKIVPLVFAPAVWFYLACAPARLRFFGAAAATVFAASLPYALQEPLTIARAVLGYGSLYGSWGWSYLLADALPATLSYARPPHGLYGPHATYATIGKWLAFALVTAASFRMNRATAPDERTAATGGPATTEESKTAAERMATGVGPAAADERMTTERTTVGSAARAGVPVGARPPLVLQCGLAASIFLALTPGFGMQYLVWLVPFVAALGPLPSLIYNLAAGCFVVASYACWFRRPPPALCSAYDYAPLMLAAWFSIILLVFFHLHRVRRNPRRAATEARR